MESERQQLIDFINESKSIKDLLMTILTDKRIDFAIRDEYWQKLLTLQNNIIKSYE